MFQGDSSISACTALCAIYDDHSMRVFTAILGFFFVVMAFTMTSWNAKFELQDHAPTFWVRAYTFAVGVALIVLFFRWPG